MKETFEVFKFDNGEYFVGYDDQEVCTTNKLIKATRIGMDYDMHMLSKHELQLLKGKLVTATISDDEQPVSVTVTVSEDELPTFADFTERKEPATFKGKIAMIKREQKLSEETLSNMLGCGKSTVHDWLHGSVPSRKFRKKIEELYKFYYEE